MCDLALVCMRRVYARTDAVVNRQDGEKYIFCFVSLTESTDMQIKVRPSRDVSQCLTNIVYCRHPNNYMNCMGRNYCDKTKGSGFHQKYEITLAAPATFVRPVH